MPARRPRKPGGTLRDAERRRLSHANQPRPPGAEPPPAGLALLWCDGGSRGNPGPAAYGFLLTDRAGEVLAEEARVIGRTTVNQAEYRGLIAGLERAHQIGITDLEVRLDSQLVVAQMQGQWRVRNPGLVELWQRAQEAARKVGNVRYRWVRREFNARADELLNRALDRAASR